MANMKKASNALLLGNGTNATLTVDDILSKGVTINQGAVIFHIHNTELSNLMRKAKIQPSGVRNGHDIYSIRDIASVCVPPAWSDEEWEEVLHKGHFPARLTKDFWNAKQARLTYLKNAGAYWHTSDVIAAVSEINKSFATSIKLIVDDVDRKAPLSQTQKDIVIQLLDNAMNNVAKRIEDLFGGKVEAERKIRSAELTGERVDDDELNDL